MIDCGGLCVGIIRNAVPPFLERKRIRYSSDQQRASIDIVVQFL
jgi:hypothetical protein